MKNNRILKSLIMCFAFVLIACLTLSFALSFGETTYADDPVNTVSFVSTHGALAGGGLIIAQINVTGKVGDVVKVKVLGVDPEAHRISLSIRKVLEANNAEYAEAPAEEAPAEDAPVEEAPAEEAPEAPAEE